MLTTPALTEEPARRSMMFGHLAIAFDERVLRPRPWTVAQSRWAAELLRTVPDTVPILELCAGAGHIGLLALVLGGGSSRHRLVSVDVDPVACAYARRNAEAAGMDARVDVREGRLDGVLGPDERFGLVIADPPWVAHDDVPRFPDDPTVSIDGGDDGLDVAWTCLEACERHLVAGGSVVLQLGSVDQALRVRARLHSSSSTLTMQRIRPFGARGVLVRLMAGHA